MKESPNLELDTLEDPKNAIKLIYFVDSIAKHPVKRNGKLGIVVHVTALDMRNPRIEITKSTLRPLLIMYPFYLCSLMQRKLLSSSFMAFYKLMTGQPLPMASLID